MALVIGAFSTLGEAERATRALLESGFPPSALSATARAGGGRLLLAEHVPVQAVGEPARLVNRTERIGASAVIGGLAGAVLTALALLLLPFAGVDPLTPVAPLRGFLSGGMAFALVVLLGALAAGGLGALLHRTRGLTNDLAVRYAMRIEQGDTVLAVRTASAGESRAAQRRWPCTGPCRPTSHPGRWSPSGSLWPRWGSPPVRTEGVPGGPCWPGPVSAGLCRRAQGCAATPPRRARGRNAPAP